MIGWWSSTGVRRCCRKGARVASEADTQGPRRAGRTSAGMPARPTGSSSSSRATARGCSTRRTGASAGCCATAPTPRRWRPSGGATTVSSSRTTPRPSSSFSMHRARGCSVRGVTPQIATTAIVTSPRRCPLGISVVSRAPSGTTRRSEPPRACLGAPHMGGAEAVSPTEPVAWARPVARGTIATWPTTNPAGRSADRRHVRPGTERWRRGPGRVRRRRGPPRASRSNGRPR